MPRLACIVTLVCAAVLAPLLLAEGPSADAAPPPKVTATVTSTTSVASNPSAEPPPSCWWVGEPATQERADLFNVLVEVVSGVVAGVTGVTTIVTVTYYSEGGTLHKWDAELQIYAQRQNKECADPADMTAPLARWVPVADPDPRMLLQRTIAEASQPISFPDPAINPPDKSAINLGMWLAVTPAGPITVRAELGRVWAETTAAVRTSTFDMGNGDEVTCAGFGTPIPDNRRDDVAPGPCGYVYERLDDVGSTTLTVTSTWSVTWELSDGRTGAQPDVVVSSPVPYRVYEIQTVGRSG